MKLYCGRIDNDGNYAVRVLDVNGWDMTLKQKSGPTMLKVLYHQRHVQHDAVFSWGTCKASAAQLSYAMIFDAVSGHVHDPRSVAKRLHHRFKSQVVSRLAPNLPWVMCEETVRAACDRIVTENFH